MTAPLPAPSAAELWSDSGRGRASLDVSCHLSLSGTGGREALALHAFSYVREPASCIVLSQDVPLDWSSVAQLMSLYICLWPAIVTAIVAARRCAACGGRRGA